MRFRREKACLGIEKSSSKVHMVEIESTGKGFQVLRYAVIEYLPDGERWAVAQVKEALAKKRFEAKIARVALSGPTLHHRIIALPPMATREMDVVVQREVRRETASPAEPFTYAFQILGELEEPVLKRREGPLALALTEAERVELLAGGVKRREVLIATAPRRMAEAQRSFAAQCGLRLESLTTIPLTLVSLLQSIESATAQGGIGFLYLSQHAGHLAIANRGRFRFSREFPLGETVQEEGLVGSEIGQEMGQTLVNELNRSMLFYTQRFRGEDLERVVLGGEGDLAAIQEILETNLGIRVEVFEPTRFLDLTPLGGEQAEFRERAPALAIAIGLAMRRVGDHTINLLPKDLQTRRGVNLGKMAAGVAAVGVLSLLLVGHQQLSARVEHLRQTLRALEGEKATLMPYLDELQKAQQERANVQAGLLFLEQVRWHARLWPEMLRELSALAPKGIRFQSLEVTRAPAGYQVSLKGEAMSKDLPGAVAALTQFYPQLRKSPFFVDLLSQLPQVPARGGNLSPAAGRPGGIRDPKADAEEMVRLDFVISGKLRLKLLFPPGL